MPLAIIGVTSFAKTERPRVASATRLTHEAVSDAANGSNEHRLPRVVAELLAQPADQHVYGAVERFPVDTVRSLDDPVAAQHASPVAHEKAEQLELGGGERERPPPQL